jgi:hypothetical protein
VQFSLSISSVAEIDIDTAYIYYEVQQFGLGYEFYDSVNESMQYILKAPFIYQEIYRGCRRCITKKFPFGIYYRIVTENAEIQVLGVIHLKRNSEIIKSRL